MIVTKNILWIDLLRIIAMFGIVLLHTTAPLLYQFEKISASYWWTANVYDSAVRVCVPLFFLISGYLLLGKSQKLSYFILKRIKKVVIPLFAWSLIYLIWKRIIVFDYTISIKSVYSIIITPSYYHLWFIYALIFVYYLIPILRKLILNSSEYTKYYFVIIWFFIVSTVPLFENFTGLVNKIDFLAMPGFAGYFVLGYIIGHKNISKKIFIIANVILILSYIFTVVSTYLLSAQNGIFNGYFYGYFSPNIILLSVTLFLSVRYKSQDIKFENYQLGSKIIEKVSAASLGIYLVHPILLHHLKNGDFGFTLSILTGHPILFIPLTTIVVFVISFFLIRILQRIPVVKYFVP